MKSIVNSGLKKLKSLPKLMKWKDSNVQLVILISEDIFNVEVKGIVLYSSSNQFQIGSKQTIHSISEWEDFDGSVTLSNY